jgi:Protein-tyrosine phosphatase
MSANNIHTEFSNTGTPVWFQCLKPEAQKFITALDTKLQALVSKNAYPEVSVDEYMLLKSNSQLFRDEKKKAQDIYKNVPISGKASVSSGGFEWIYDATPMSSEYTDRKFLLHKNPSSLIFANVFLHTIRNLGIHHVITAKNNFEQNNGRDFWLYNIEPDEQREIKIEPNEFYSQVAGKFLSEAERKKLSAESAIKLTLLKPAIHTLSNSSTDVIARSFTTQREFEVEYADGSKHHFTHHQLNGWRDQGLIDLNPILKVIASLPEDSPVSVHCEGGLGRSGTFTAILAAVDYFKKTGKMPPLARLFANLRSQRDIIENSRQLNLVAVALQEIEKNGLELRTKPNKEIIAHIENLTDHLYPSSTSSSIHFLQRIDALPSEEILMKLIGSTVIPYDLSDDDAEKILKANPEDSDRYNTLMDGLSEYARREFLNLAIRVPACKETFKLLWEAAGKGISLINLQEEHIPRTNNITCSDVQLKDHAGLFGLLWSGYFEDVKFHLYRSV